MDNLIKEQRRKIYFAEHVKEIIGKPDIVFRRKKVIVFIDSDFGHGHPKHFIMPSTRHEYWTEKITGNVARDKKVTLELKSQGWKVVRIWEYDVKYKFQKSIQKILVAIGKE